MIHSVTYKLAFSSDWPHYSIQGDTAIGFDEGKTTKQEKDKLSKFKHSSKTTRLILNSEKCSWMQVT